MSIRLGWPRITMFYPVSIQQASGGQLAGDEMSGKEMRGEVRKAAGYCEKARTC